MADKGRVLVVGNIVLDFIVGPVLEPPQRERTIKVDNSGLFTGGCRTNPALLLNRFGIDTALVGTLGDDDLGHLLTMRLREEGVETRGLITCGDVDTSITAVLIWEGGERSFLHSGSNSRMLSREHLDRLNTSGVDHIHIGGALLLTGVDAEDWAETLRRFKHAGAITSLDPAWDTRGLWIRSLELALPYIDYLLPNRVEAQMLTGESDPERAGCSLVDMGVGQVVVKMGVEGSLMVGAGGVVHQEAFKVKAVDTTGAGDAFDAGFIAALLHGEEGRAAMGWGAAAGALAVTDYGATTAVRSKEQVLSLLSRA